jgi:hypothetical protein
MQDLRITLESGEGLLDARALWASIVGPHRLAMGSRRAVTLRRDQPTLIAENIGRADAYVFVGFALPFGAAVGTLPVIFSRDSEMGNNNAIPASAQPVVTGSLTGTTQILLPGEQLFGQIADPAIDGQNIVVAEVVF